jgi:hypothetical protein
MELPKGVTEVPTPKPRYKVVAATSFATLTDELNNAASEGYKAILTLEVQDGKEAVIMELER